jgi:Dolichyl-phosphate-mannose-protein mannosyltransferase
MQSRRGVAAIAVTFCGFLARVWAAHGTFLNPDEALHFRLANQPTLALAYRESLTASHPPLLTVVLYYWRALGASELWLRMPLVLASAAFCWISYKWLAKAAGEVAGLIGLLFVAFLAPIVALGAEIRQYALLLAFLAGALYCLDEALEKKSAGKMAAFSLCLYLAMLSHYSAFLFAAAMGIYALVRIVGERIRGSVVGAWIGGQVGGVALAMVLYETHISKLGAGYAKPVLQGWMSDQFLRHSYFDAARENALSFVVWHSFGVFQYFFGQLAVGDVMGLAFMAGIVLLLWRKDPTEENNRSRRLALLLVLPFAIAAGASLAHVYPYGGTRHVAFLIIPGIAGVSTAMARLNENKAARAAAIASFIVILCLGFGKTRRPYINRADQNRANVTRAMGFVRANVGTSSLIFTDYESDLVLGHYLCGQRPISFESSNAEFEAFNCGQRVVSAGYKAGPLFTAENFPRLWDRLIEQYRLQPGETVWVFQAGWDADLPEELRSRLAEFRNLQFESFGGNIKIFKVTVGRVNRASAVRRRRIHRPGNSDSVSQEKPGPRRTRGHRASRET